MTVDKWMTSPAITIGAEESVEVAARTLTHYNIGALPVCSAEGKLCGMITDRDLVTRCMAAGSAKEMTVGQIMTANVLSVDPQTTAAQAARLMGQQQIRRLPVTENGKLVGMLSLSDLARKDSGKDDAAQALRQISSHISHG